MKKVFAYTLISTFVLAALSGCDNDSKKKTPDVQKPQVTVSTNKAAEQTKKEEPAAEKTKTEEQTKVFDLGSVDKNYSYAVGATVGSDFHRNMKASEDLGIHFDIDAMRAGFSDSVAGKNKMSDDDMKKYLSVLENTVKDKMEAKAKEESDRNLKEGKEFLAKNAKVDGVKVTPSGLQYRVNVQGSGDKVESNDDIVSVVYTGKLVNGKVFDSNEGEGKKPLEFPVGGVIQGWQEGIKLMTVGSDYDFYIPSELAYGDQKMPGNVIPPNSTLIFHVKLVGVKHSQIDGKSGASEETVQGQPESQNTTENNGTEQSGNNANNANNANNENNEKPIPQVDADAADL